MGDLANIPPTGLQDPESVETVAAVSRLGVTGLASLYQPWAGRGASGMGGIGGTGATSPVAGAFELSTTAVAGRFTQIAAYNDGTTWAKHIRNGQNWYISGRYACIVTAGATTKTFVGGGDIAGNELRMGVYGPSSTANFTLSAGASTLDSGMAIDSSFHTFRAWRVGGFTYLEIDGVLRGSPSAAVNNSTDLSLFHIVFNNADAVNQRLQLVWTFAAAPSL